MVMWGGWWSRPVVVVSVVVGWVGRNEGVMGNVTESTEKAVVTLLALLYN